MPDHPSIAIMNTALDAFASGDVDAMMRIFAPDIIWCVPGQGPLAGCYIGHAEFFGFLGKLAALSKGSFALHPKWMVTDDDRLVLFHGTTAQRGDRTLDVDILVHVRIRDGQIIAGTDYIRDEHRWDAFWA